MAIVEVDDLVAKIAGEEPHGRFLYEHERASLGPIPSWLEHENVARSIKFTSYSSVFAQLSSGFRFIRRGQGVTTT
ncbi:hypothetical protein, partial [Sinorhizobium fredii]